MSEERKVPLDVSCLPSNLSSCTESEAKLALVDRHLHGTLVMSEMVSGNVEEPTSGEYNYTKHVILRFFFKITLPNLQNKAKEREIVQH